MINEARAQSQKESGFRTTNLWSHFHHKSLWYSSPPVQLSVFKPYTKERKGLRPGALSLFYLINTHHHTTHSLLTHVYVSWTHITIHHSKLTTQGYGWENHCEAILAWRLSPVQFPPLDPHNPWTSKVSSARTLEHIWKLCYRLFLSLFEFMNIFWGISLTTPEWPMSWFCWNPWGRLSGGTLLYPSLCCNDPMIDTIII